MEFMKVNVMKVPNGLNSKKDILSEMCLFFIYFKPSFILKLNHNINYHMHTGGFVFI